MFDVLRIVFVILGTLIGAGFASGKEIYSFFYVYDFVGIVGIIISSSIIGLVICRVLGICNKNKIDSYESFCNYIVGNRKFWADVLNNIVNIFVLITFFVMIAGFASLLKQELGLNKFIGSLIILSLNYIVSLKSVKGLVKLSNFLIPVFIIFLILISFKISSFQNSNIQIENDVNLSNKNINITFQNNKSLNENINNDSMKNNKTIIFQSIEGILKGILYASYNCIILIPVLVILRKQIFQKRKIVLVSIISALVIILLSMCIYNLLTLGNSDIYKMEMPVISIIEKAGGIYKQMYIILIAISIFTTAISSCITFLNNIQKNNKNLKRNLTIITIFAIMFAQISFGTLVNMLYPVLGIIGIVEVIIVLKPKRNELLKNTCKNYQKLV